MESENIPLLRKHIPFLVFRSAISAIISLVAPSGEASSSTKLLECSNGAGAKDQIVKLEEDIIAKEKISDLLFSAQSTEDQWAVRMYGLNKREPYMISPQSALNSRETDEKLLELIKTGGKIANRQTDGLAE